MNKDCAKQNHKWASVLTPKNSISDRRDAISPLLRRAKANDIAAYFQLGMIMLCEGRVGFAQAFLRSAAKGGNIRAQKYLKLLPKQGQSIKDWCRKVMQAEAKFIVFGDQDDVG